VLTAVVDRGILGAEVFEKVLADPALHLITWRFVSRIATVHVNGTVTKAELV
jgi:hypothetical protein